MSVQRAPLFPAPTPERITGAPRLAVRVADRPGPRHRLATAGLLVAALALLPATTSAQCAVCGNPAFSAGDNDVARTFAGGSRDGTRVTAGLVYATQRYTDLYTGTTRLSDDEKRAWVYTPEWALRIHLLTVLAGVELSTGTELSLVLPMGIAQSTRVADDGVGTSKDANGAPIETSSDSGLSDLELRVRQRLSGLVRDLPGWMPQVVVAAGMVAPTGSFIVKDPAGATTDQYVSLGRGAFWAVADLDVFGAATSRLGWVLSLGSRVPLTDNVNDGYLFRWGPEVRTTAAANAVLIAERLHASLGFEWQWRATGKERFTPADPIADFPNGGGNWLTLQPTLQLQLAAGFALTATARIPLWREVNGFQPVPGFGAIAALNWAWRSGADSAAASGAGAAGAGAAAGSAGDGQASRRPAKMPAVGERPSDPMLAALLVPGKIVLVDWWATWCQVCKKLAPNIEAYARAREGVVLRKIDVTDWEADKLGPYLSDAPELPVVDIYDEKGRLLRRLSGAAALGFAAHLPQSASATAD